LSKIVVVVRTYEHSELGLGTVIEEFLETTATNNDRGELIIHKPVGNTPTDEEIKLQGKYQKFETVAVFKDWVYWKEIK
jgi:hypothetical protein